MANMLKMQPVTKIWYDSLKEGRAMGLKCSHCGNIEFPPVPVCNHCGRHDMDWVEVSGDATLVSYCWSGFGAAPFWNEPVMIAHFDLAEGNHVQTFLLGVTKEDEPYLFANCPLPCRMEIVKVSEEHDLYYPVFRLVQDPKAKAGAEEIAVEEAASGGAADPEKLDKLNALVAEIYGADKDCITAGTTFVNDLNGDSMKRAIFSAEVEELTGIEITQAKLRVMETVGDLYAELGDWLA